jgi:hypothetical protein
LKAARINFARLGLTQGRHAVIKTISTGDNWFYKARDGCRRGSSCRETETPETQ